MYREGIPIHLSGWFWCRRACALTRFALARATLRVHRADACRLLADHASTFAGAIYQLDTFYSLGLTTLTSLQTFHSASFA